MTVVETAAEDAFVVLERTEARHEAIALRRVTDVAIMGVIVAVQVSWLAACTYAAYLFVV